MTELEATSWEAVHAVEAGDLDRLAAALEARRKAMQRAGLHLAGLAERTTSAPASDPVLQNGSGETDPGKAVAAVIPEVFALGEQVAAQLRQIADGIRQRQARLETIQSGFALNASLKPRLDFRG